MATVLRSTLSPLVRNVANMENSQLVTDAEVLQYLDWSAKRLYDLVTQGGGAPPLTTRTLLAVTAGSYQVALPTDFYLLLGLYAQTPGATDWYPMDLFGDREVASGLSTPQTGLPGRYGYRLAGTQSGSDGRGGYQLGAPMLEVTPTPSTGLTVRLDYVPTVANAPYGSAPADVVYEGFNGWEEWIVLRAAAYCLAKEESDTSFVQGELARLERDIRVLSIRRGSHRGGKIRDVGDDFGCGPWGDGLGPWGRWP